MNKSFAKRLITTTLILILAGLSLSYAFEAYNDTDLVIAEEQLIEGDYIKANNRILNKGKITGDFMVAGTDIEHQGVIEGDLIAAASEGRVAGIVKGDIRVVGNNILIEGAVSRNASIFANRIVQYKDSIIEGSVHVFSSQLDLRGYIGGDVRGANQDTTISGTIKGNVYIHTSKLRLLPDALIEGNLIYVSGDVQQINPKQVKGRIEHRYPTTATRRDFADKIQGAIKTASVFSRIIFLISYLLAGILLILVFKNPYRRAAALIQEQPWYSVGLGVSILICVPIVAIILMITVIGIPFGLIGLALYGILVYIAKIPVGIWLGSRIFRGEERLIIWFVIGTLILEATKLIPHAGWLISFGALAIGLGSTLMMVKRYYRNENTGKGPIPPVH